MKFSVKFNDFTDYDAIERIYDKLKNHDAVGNYNIFVEYNSDAELLGLTDEVMMEIKPEYLRFLKKMRLRFNDLPINVKKLYLLGTIVVAPKDELRIIVEKAEETDPVQNIMWPSKELFLYDGSKRVLDSLLENDQIDIDEYELKLKILRMEFGLFDFLEEDYYVN
ncbi:MAG: hypothetical protein JXQ26_06450 [Tissierellales bacterium]|nr:hypothetical protein [Tissierellales bacterium]MBN2827609.1 hypothetical protein [Tissierellales bacterium]